MQTVSCSRQFLMSVGTLLEYPAENSWESLPTLLSQVELVSQEAAKNLKDFYESMGTLDLSMRQEHYVQSFDVTPASSLYLSVHLFGEESFKRAELMAGLKCRFEKDAPLAMAELPDHLAVILKESSKLESQEWTELVEMALLPALPKMISELEKVGNPFALLLKSVHTLLMQTETAHA